MLKVAHVILIIILVIIAIFAVNEVVFEDNFNENSSDEKITPETNNNSNYNYEKREKQIRKLWY